MQVAERGWRVQFILKLLSCTLIAVVLAFLSGWLMLKTPRGGIANGPWRTDPTTGSARAGLYHRARVATFGIWALDSSEVVYFFTETDSGGNPLKSNCTYRIVGRDPDTRWWSITAYLDDHYIPNPINRYSYSKTTVEREPDGSWVITLAPEKQGRNWLPSGERGGTLNVSLRNYNPGRTLIETPGNVELPRVIREGCK